MKDNVKNDRVERLFNFNDLGPTDINLLRLIEEKCLNSLKNSEFQLVDPPAIESSDLFFRKSLGSTSSSTYTFMDFTNQQISLRPDFTASVIRLIFSDEIKSKFGFLNKTCYSGPVFRYTVANSDPIQIYQVGAEYLSDKGSDADTEVLRQAINCLSLTGISDYSLSLGHVGILRHALINAGYNSSIVELVMSNLESLEGDEGFSYLVKKANLLKLLKGTNEPEAIATFDDLGKKYASRMSSAIGLREKQDILNRYYSKISNQVSEGDLLDCLNFTQNILGFSLKDFLNNQNSNLSKSSEDYGEFVIVIQNLLSEGINEENIDLDFTLTRNLAYYNGIVFDLKTRNSLILGGGGRYDDLPQRLGYVFDEGCSGFALNLSRIIELMSN